MWRGGHLCFLLGDGIYSNGCVSSSNGDICRTSGTDIGLIHQAAGADYTMEGFVKVTGRRPEEGPVPEKRSADKKTE